MLRNIATALVFAFALAAGFSLAGTSEGQAREKGANIFDHNTGKWVKKRKIYRRNAPAPKYRRRTVTISTKQPVGTIIVDTKSKFLYHVTSKRRAVRYGIGVGRDGFEWRGQTRLARKAKWPSWTPPKEMIEREWRENKRRVSFMKGGPKNPLGARALYLHWPKGGDTGYRIHGTNEPWSIGLSMSSGCIRMLNKDVEHLYNNVKLGSKVIVIGPDGKGRRKLYSEGFNPLRAIFARGT